jgi:hypothetical protein
MILGCELKSAGLKYDPVADSWEDDYEPSTSSLKGGEFLDQLRTLFDEVS